MHHHFTGWWLHGLNCFCFARMLILSSGVYYEVKLDSVRCGLVRCSSVNNNNHDHNENNDNLQMCD